MKTHLIFSAFGLALLMTACQKDAAPGFDDALVATAAADRCGCLPPFELNAHNATDQSVEIQWTSMPEALAYRIEVANSFYTGDAFDDFLFLETTESSSIAITHLTPNTRYEYRVTTICGNGDTAQSDIRVFYTADILHGDPPVKSTKTRHDKYGLEIQ